jgi:hypothetical protein
VAWLKLARRQSGPNFSPTRLATKFMASHRWAPSRPTGTGNTNMDFDLRLLIAGLEQLLAEKITMRHGFE